MTPVTDLAFVGADPRFGGGALAQMEAFWRAAVELGRKPVFDYVAHPSLAGAPLDGSPLDGPGLKAPFGRIDAASQLAAGVRLAPRLRAARSVWVVSTTAAHGYAALRSGHPYDCWIGTGLEDEWAGRRPGLPATRRLAIRLNGPVLRRLERRVLQGARHVYATSPWSRGSVARAAGIDEDRVGLLPIPVALDRFYPAPDEKWRATIAEPVLAFVGRANDTRKNVQLLLDAFALLPQARLLLVGSSPPGRLPERVEATGIVPAVAPHLRRATLFVLPSRQEGFGIVVAEALATGLPVVTTPCGGPEALVRDSGGGVVLSSFTPEELASTIRGLVADPVRLEELRRNGRAHVVRAHSPGRFRGLLEAALARGDEP